MNFKEWQDGIAEIIEKTGADYQIKFAFSLKLNYFSFVEFSSQVIFGDELEVNFNELVQVQKFVREANEILEKSDILKAEDNKETYKIFIEK